MAAVPLFGDTNMAAVTLRENTLLEAVQCGCLFQATSCQ